MAEDEIIKKIIGHGSLEFNNGELKVWNISSILIPLHTQIILEWELCKRFKNEARDLLYYLAKYQAYGGTKLLHQQYGFKDMTKAVELELQTCALMGMGKLHLLQYNPEKCFASVKFTPNPAARIRKQLYGLSKEPTDHFARGGMSGIFSYAFGKDMVGIEIQCEQCGKPYCIIEVREKDKWDLNNPMIKNQFPKLESEYKEILEKLNAINLKK